MNPFLTALSFLTIIKIDPKTYDIKNSPYFFPAVGFIIGIPLFFILKSDIYLKELLSIAYLVVITGALHLDGLSDTCDGIFSHKDRLQKLEIMKDSRIGVMGCVCIVLIILIKYELFKITAPSFVPVALFFGRFTGITFMASLPYARVNGTAKSFEAFNILSKNRNIIYLIASFLLILLVLNFITFLAIFILSIFISYFFSKLFFKILGGYTGDTVGAVIEVSEVLILYILICIY
jgi:adenosylcobinamide-GDP ribazoletransferase